MHIFFFIFLFRNKTSGRERKKCAISIRDVFVLYGTSVQHESCSTKSISQGQRHQYHYHHNQHHHHHRHHHHSLFARINECATQKLNSKVNSNVHPSVSFSPFPFPSLIHLPNKKKKSQENYIKQIRSGTFQKPTQKSPYDFFILFFFTLLLFFKGHYIYFLKKSRQHWANFLFILLMVN